MGILSGPSKRAKEAGAAGMINTSWAGSGTPFELAWYGHCWAANCCWNTEAERESFDRAYAREFFGVEEPDLLRASGQDVPGDGYDIACAQAPVRKWRPLVKRNRFHLDALSLAMDKLMFRLSIGRLIYGTIEYRAMHRAVSRRREVAGIREQIKDLIRRDEALRRRTAALYKKGVPPNTLREEVAGQFNYVARILEILDRNLVSIIRTGESPPRIYRPKI